MPEQTPALFLIDGNSLVYRAFFALPESIATSTGVPTNAIFGFASMLVKLITEHGLTPAVVAWDAGTSGRTDTYPAYKAQRQSRPDLLREQWPAFEPLVDAFGYRNARLEGYEADDVIATLAQRAIEQRIPVSIVTGDRDAFQLVDEEGLVTVYATARGITETKLYDRAAVIERYGIAPEQIPDFYGLKGDTSDNSPGVPGIGEKTAAELLQNFGSLEQLLERTTGERRQAPREPRSAPRRRVRLQAARHDAARPAARAVAQPTCCAASPIRRRCAPRSAATSCATRCAASRRRSSRCPRPPRPRRGRSAAVRGDRWRDALARLAAGAARRPSPCALRRSRKGRCSARAGRGASRVATGGEVLIGDCAGRGGGCARSARAPSSPTTPKRWGSSRRRSTSTRCSPATCWTRPAAATRSPSSARTAGSTPAARRIAPPGEAAAIATLRPRRSVPSSSSAAWMR